MNPVPKNAQKIEDLRKLWQQAVEDKHPYQPAEAVLSRLERKYLTLAKAAGK